MQSTSNGILDYWSHAGSGSGSERWIAPLKDHPGSGVWRCWADPGDDCGSGDGDNVHHPVSQVPVEASLPVLTLTSAVDSCHLAANDVDLCHVTSGAVLLKDWEEMDVRYFDPNSGTTVFNNEKVWHRVWGAILSSSDLGGEIGVQQNVAVFEYEAAFVSPDGFSGGTRLERYFFVPGIGLARSQGRKDTACVASPSPGQCTGNYDAWEGTDAKFNDIRYADFRFDLALPYVVTTSWWNQ